MGFDFGFGFWILFFVIFFGCGRICGWGARRYRKRDRDLEGARPTDDEHLTRLESRVRRRERAAAEREQLVRPAVYQRAGGRDRERQPVTARRSPLKELQEKFIAGGLTMEEYERELDRLERLE